MADGATSDVPIHGEKTNILFHPTPSVSYQPMFEALEKRASALTVGISVAIIFLGRMFGDSFWGLLPLAFCIASGVWLWVQEVIRSGREMEWNSEELRGKTVRLTGYRTINQSSILIFPGNCESATRVCRMDEYFPWCCMGSDEPGHVFGNRGYD